MNFSSEFCIRNQNNLQSAIFPSAFFRHVDVSRASCLVELWFLHLLQLRYVAHRQSSISDFTSFRIDSNSYQESFTGVRYVTSYGSRYGHREFVIITPIAFAWKQTHIRGMDLRAWVVKAAPVRWCSRVYFPTQHEWDELSGQTQLAV